MIWAVYIRPWPHTPKTPTSTDMARLLALLLVLCSLNLRAIELSDSSRISLLTCAPGSELYSCFGHSGIRVTDYRLGLDIVFNYGTFDFDQPDFYLNFCKGHMIYMLGVDRFEDFRTEYIEEKRSIYEQVIDLKHPEKQIIFDFLTKNSERANRSYRYDFLFDNCATRIRDVFEKNLSSVKFDYSTFTERKSFRDLINDYSMDKPWEQFGMGLLIGLPVDRIATHQETTFLPDYLSRGFAHATISDRPLCLPSHILLDIPSQHQSKSIDQIITPLVFWAVLLVLLLVITYLGIQRHKHSYWLDVILFFVAGLLGMLMFVLGGFTEHTTTQWNLNMFWAWPTHLLTAFLLPFMKKKKWMAVYFLLAAISAAIMVLGFKLLPQHFLLANILIAAIYSIRSYSIYRASTF